VSHERNGITAFLTGPALVDVSVLFGHGEFVLLAAEWTVGSVIVCVVGVWNSEMIE
jgi:hypothetical protein